jgi:hypothetical protein
MTSRRSSHNKRLHILVGLAMLSLLTVSFAAWIAFKSSNKAGNMRSGSEKGEALTEGSSKTRKLDDGQGLDQDPAGITSDEDKSIGPAPPQDLQVICHPGGPIILTWFDDDSFVKSFRVYESTPRGRTRVAAPLRSSATNSLTIRHKVVSKNSSSTFEVSAVDIYGQESDSTVGACK